MEHIRKATPEDAARIAEIEIFNYRLNFYPIFQSDDFYFNELQVSTYIESYLTNPDKLKNTYVYDDGVVKGFARNRAGALEKLFVEPVLQGQGIGAALLKHAVNACGARELWALEKNTRAIAFYGRHGFSPTGERMLEEDTTEYLVKLTKNSTERE